MRTRSINDNEIAQLINWGCEQCHKISDSPQLDAEILLTHVLGKSRSYCRTWPEKSVSSEHIKLFKTLVALRLKPTPIAYLTGFKEFWSRNFKVNEHTLIPRPDTELLIEHALHFLSTQKTIPRVLDLGTGTGCIAITLKKEYPHCEMYASDISSHALTLAQENALILEAKVTFLHSSWFELIPKQPFHLIVSNPPYIAQGDTHLQQGDLPAEPITALTSGKEGLDAIHTIIHQAISFLAPEGMLMLEHGYDQKQAVYDLLQQTGYQEIKQHHDLSQHARVSTGIKP